MHNFRRTIKFRRPSKRTPGKDRDFHVPIHALIVVGTHTHENCWADKKRLNLEIMDSLIVIIKPEPEDALWKVKQSEMRRINGKG